MTRLRLIARIEAKGSRAVKGVRLDGIRQVGDPAELAARYEEAGADEIQYQDVVASLYGREPDYAAIERVASAINIPLVVGGGITTVEQARRIIGLGCERVSVNSAALRDEDLLPEFATALGASSITLHVEAKRTGNRWRCYADGGREDMQRDVGSWIEQASPHCAEVVVQSVDQDGTCEGFDIPLTLHAMANARGCGVVALGGCGTIAHLREVSAVAGVAGIAWARALHEARVEFYHARTAMRRWGLNVRGPEVCMGRSA